MGGEAEEHSLGWESAGISGLVAKPLCPSLRAAKHQGRNRAGITTPLTHCLRDNPTTCASKLKNAFF